MNQQTLSYHTRLHDWYRQHSLQQEKQTETRAPSKQNLNPSSDLIALGVLTRDKLHFINEWCSDVNRTMFSIKKKEASPLYRKCRLSAPIKAAMKDKPTAPRRVRSAEVFTLRDQWAKAPKVNVQGGELLANSRAARNSASRSEGRRVKENNSPDIKSSEGMCLGSRAENVDFCVTNSLDKSNDVSATMPRVNHDSFDRRIHPSVIKKTSNNINVRSPVVSPRGHLTSVAKTNNESSEPPIAPRSKSASVLRPPKQEIGGADDNQARQGSAKTLPKNHKVLLDQNEVKKTDMTKRQKQRVTSASQKSVKASTDLNTSVGDAEIRGILNDTEPDNNTRGEFPTFCGKCSGIYSGNAPPPPTPVTCGSCVHGITINGNRASQGQKGPSNAEIQKELAQKLVETEKTYNKKITHANIQLKMSENRVTEDSIHYTLEREILRVGQEKSETLHRKDDEDFPDDADLSIENCDDNDLSLDNTDNADDYHGPENTEENEGGQTADKATSCRQIPIVTIITEGDHDADDSHEANENQNSNVDDDKLSASSTKRRGDRRMSIHFTYKPMVGNISISNKLLHFLSIDDCKQAMRYYPHKVLEKHEVTGDPILMLQNNLALQRDEDGPNDNETASSDGKVAMRISRGSTITSLHSSSANNATNANKKQYKILFDPEDLEYYKNKRPSSMSLARAFNTLIYDRTIMQRLEEKGSRQKTKALNNVGKTLEGPKYRLINNALKKQIGERMQAQCQEMVQRYQRRKSGMLSISSKRQDGTGTPSRSSDRSLSLESLPSVKKGIWSENDESLH